MTDFFLTVLAGAFGITRFFVPSRPLSWPGTYQAFAHILVGVLLGGFLWAGDYACLYILLLLTAVEVAAFTLSKVVGK